MKKFKIWLIHLLGGVTVTESRKNGEESFYLGMKVHTSIFVTMPNISTASLPMNGAS